MVVVLNQGCITITWELSYLCLVPTSLTFKCHIPGNSRGVGVCILKDPKCNLMCIPFLRTTVLGDVWCMYNSTHRVGLLGIQRVL